MENGLVKKHGSNCTFSIPYTGDNFQKLRMFTGFSKFVDGSRDLIFRPTANNIKYLNENWPDAVWDESVQHILSEFIQQQIDAEANRGEKKKILEDDGSYEYKTEPFDHQRQAFLLSRDKRWFALLMEQGTGKTKVLIDNGAYLYSQGKIDSIILIAPNGVHANFIDTELEEHWPDWCPKATFIYSSNMTKAKQQEFEDVMASENSCKIFAFNVEGFVSEKAKKLIERVIRTCKPLGAVDESQYCKNPTSKRSKYVKKQFKNLEYKRIMTGTAITKGVEDVYGQFGILDDSILGFDTFTSFKQHYCVMGGYEMREIVGYKNTNEIIEAVDSHSYRVLKKDCLDIPPKMYKRWRIDLTRQQRRIYDDLKKNFIAECEGDTITAELAIVRALRLQQITCGWFPSEKGEDMKRITGDNPRLEAVRQHCRIMDDSVIIWAKFTQDIELIAEQLRKDHGHDMVETFYGKTKQEKRPEIKENFQAKKFKFLVAHAQAAGRGYTFTACNNPIYHSCDYDLELRLQSEDRCHRHGTIGQVTYTDVEAIQTVDAKIIKSLIAKKSLADFINQDPASLFMEEE